jgi:hypothetical protein
LTAIYYIWKNAPSEYVGLYHYRRYLNFKIDNSILDDLVPGRKFYEVDDGLIDYLTDDGQHELVKYYMNIADVVIPRKSILLPSIKGQYSSAVENEPWCEFEKAIESKYGSNVNLLKYFEINPLSPICNMFIMKWSVFDAYCKDMFEIIDNIYKIIGTPYDDHNNRYPGFLAERFLGFWLNINNIRYLEVPMIAFK